MKTTFVVLVVIFALSAPARAQKHSPQPDLSDEAKWVQQVEKTVPEAELDAAAADAEVRQSGDPLMALAAKYGLDAPPDWLRERVEGQAAAVTLAALGDSVTAATASCKFPYYYCPGNSWTAGSLPTSVRSELEDGSGREVRGLLVAVPGVRMKTIPAEAFVIFLASAFGLDVERMTLLIGHNDPGVCGAPDAAEAAAFAKRYATALRILGRVARARRAKLYVSGLIDVPAVARYADLIPDGAGKTCAELWRETGRCRLLLEHRDDPTAVARVEAQVAAYNALLAAGVVGKSWAMYAPTFTEATRGGFDDPAAELSPLDCFHPSAAGQAHLGRAAWEGEAGVPGIASFFALPEGVARAPRSEDRHAPAPSERLSAELGAWRSVDARP